MLENIYKFKLRHQWFWNWLEGNLWKNNFKNGLLVKLISWLGWGKSKKRMERQRALSDVFHHAQKELSQEEFINWLQNGYFQAVDYFKIRKLNNYIYFRQQDYLARKKYLARKSGKQGG